LPDFDFLAQHYNAMTGFPGRIAAVKEAIQPWVAEWNVVRALDAGCGGGVLLLALEECNVQTVGIDLSRPMLELARDNARDRKKTFELREASFASAGALYPMAFDAVFCLGNSIVGAANDEEMGIWLAGLRDALRPGGGLLLQLLNLTPFKLGLKNLINRRSAPNGEYVRAAAPSGDGITFCALFLGPDNQTDVHFSHWQLWEAERLAGCVRDAGFKQAEVFGSLKKALFDPRTSTDLVIAARRS
jgi:SAM-dependent methyltransferase